MKKLITAMLILALLLAGCEGSPAPTESAATDMPPMPAAISSPTAGQGNSQSQIDQDLLTGEWEQIVQDTSLFQVGEQVPGPYYEAGGPGGMIVEYGSYPKMDGSTVMVPLAMEAARQFLGMDGMYLEHMALFSTTHDAYVNLITGRECYTADYYGMIMDNTKTVDVVLGTAPSEEEYQLATDMGVDLMVAPICLDGFVFITHEDNPVDNLSWQQIKDIYSGKTTNWQDVGGPDLPIVAYQRSPNSGSQTAMERSVMLDVPMMEAPTEQTSSGMGALIDAIKEYENSPDSIGYTYKYYIDELYGSEGVKMLSVDGVYPDAESIREFRYPFSTYYNAVVLRDEQDGNGYRFALWLRTEEGQACVEQAGYIPLRPDMIPERDTD